MFSSAEIRGVVRGFAEAFDPALIDAGDAALVVRDWAAIEHMAATVKALAAGRVADCDGVAHDGCGVAGGVAGQDVGHHHGAGPRDVGHRGSPVGARGDGGGGAGGVSCRRRRLRRSLMRRPPTRRAERDLLGKAKRSSLGELRDTCAKTKAAADPNPEATHRRIRGERRLRRYRGADGAEHLHANGTAEDVALVDSALAPIIERIFNTARADGRREPLEAYAFDALIELARGAGIGANTDEADEAGPAKAKAKTRRGT